MLEKAPCMLPELDSIEAVYVEDSSYWFVYFDRHNNWDQLKKILQSNGCIDIKQKAGCFSHLEDPNKLKTMLTETLTSEQYKTWRVNQKNLSAFFKNQQYIYSLASQLVFPARAEQIDDVGVTSRSEEAHINWLMLQTYNCLKKDRMHALSIYIGVTEALSKWEKSAAPHRFVWQIKMIAQLLESFKHINEEEFFLSYEILSALLIQFKTKIDTFATQYRDLLKCLMSPGNLKTLQEVEEKILNQAFVSLLMNDVPFNRLPIPERLDEHQTILGLHQRGFSTEAIAFVQQILD